MLSLSAAQGIADMIPDFTGVDQEQNQSCIIGGLLSYALPLPTSPVENVFQFYTENFAPKISEYLAMFIKATVIDADDAAKACCDTYKKRYLMLYGPISAKLMANVVEDESAKMALKDIVKPDKVADIAKAIISAADDFTITVEDDVDHQPPESLADPAADVTDEKEEGEDDDTDNGDTEGDDNGEPDEGESSNEAFAEPFLI